LVHIDTYRLGQPEELARLRFNELLRDPETVIMIEWAEKVEILLPADYRRLNFKFIDETTREIIW
jgi:tRNA A37 threonylcarbamoyladenosine biosynthesis protein TsaE